MTNSYKPDYFNSTAAYRSVGFQEIHFPQEYSGGEGYLSVGATGAYVFVAG